MTANLEIVTEPDLEALALPAVVLPGYEDPEGGELLTAEAVLTSDGFEVPFDEWVVGVFKRCREDGVRRQAAVKAAWLARTVTNYCMMCGEHGELPDRVMDQKCIDTPPAERNDGLPRWFMYGPNDHP